MTPFHIVILLVTGVFTGFASGLLGIGGGIIMTPVQYIVYSGMGLPADIAVRLTFGTSLAVILPTAVSGAWKHRQHGLIRKKVVLIMGGCSLIGAFGGAAIAAHLPGHVLKVAFGVLLLGSLVRMLTASTSAPGTRRADAPWLWAIWATIIGVVSGILGVGGGIMLIPVLVVVLRFGMHEALATSLGVVAFTSIGGGLGYIVNGLAATGLPPYSLGFVYLPAWALLSVTSISMAQVGAATANRLPGKYLKYLFMALLLYLGLRMTGIFELLGLPL